MISLFRQWFTETERSESQIQTLIHLIKRGQNHILDQNDSLNRAVNCWMREDWIPVLTGKICWFKHWLIVRQRREPQSSSKIDWFKHLNLSFDQNDSLTQTQTGVNLGHDRNASFNWKISFFRHGLADRSKSCSGMKRFTDSWSTNQVQHTYNCTFTPNPIHCWVDITQNLPHFS